MKKIILLNILFFLFVFTVKSQVVPINGPSGTFGVNATQYVDYMNVQYNISTGTTNQYVKVNLTYSLETACDYVQIYECDDNFSSWVYIGTLYTGIGSVQIQTQKPNGKAVLFFHSDASVNGAHGFTGFSATYEAVAATTTTYPNTFLNNMSTTGTVEFNGNCATPNLTVTDYAVKNMGAVNSITTDFTKSMLLLKSSSFQLGLGANKISANGFLGISASQIYYNGFSHYFSTRSRPNALVIEDGLITCNSYFNFNTTHFMFGQGGGNIYFGNGGAGDLRLRVVPVGGKLDNYRDIMIIKNNGSIGIGTEDVGNFKLKVAGDLYANNVGIGTNSPAKSLSIYGDPAINPSCGIRLENGRIWDIENNESSDLTFSLDGTSRLSLTHDRGMHIGALGLEMYPTESNGSGDAFSIDMYNTSQPTFRMINLRNHQGVDIWDIQQDGTMHVGGKIITKEIEVKPDVWADDVFNHGYKLMSLAELEKYIQVNKHLPLVPTEAEVAEKGINIGDMNAVLLRKVEELTLLMIEQQKEINSLKQKLSE